MKLSDYIAMRKEDLFGFENEWENGNNDDPENWPLEQDEEDWYEQEMVYNNMERED